jgi:hypothetical protein
MGHFVQVKIIFQLYLILFQDGVFQHSKFKWKDYYHFNYCAKTFSSFNTLKKIHGSM